MTISQIRQAFLKTVVQNNLSKISLTIYPKEEKSIIKKVWEMYPMKDQESLPKSSHKQMERMGRTSSSVVL